MASCGAGFSHGAAREPGCADLAVLVSAARAAEFATPVPTLRSIPRFLTIGARRALVYALQAIKDAGTAQRRLQSWKLLLLTPRGLEQQGDVKPRVGRGLAGGHLASPRPGPRGQKLSQQQPQFHQPGAQPRRRLPGHPPRQRRQRLATQFPPRSLVDMRTPKSLAPLGAS